MRNAVQPRRSTGVQRQSVGRRGASGKTWARAILVLAVLLTFSQACYYDFVDMDDYPIVANNPEMNPPTWHSLKDWWSTPQFQLYIPVSYTVQGGIALLARVPPDPQSGFSLNPRVFHIVNILLQIEVTLLVYQLLLYLKIREWPACAGALVFGIHPVQVEPVVWITSIKDLLYGTFGLLAIWGLLVSLDSPSDSSEPTSDRARARRSYFFATLCFVLAMLSKPTAVIIPLVALPLVWLQYRQVCWRRVWLRLGFWAALAIPISVIAKYAQPAPYTLGIPIWRRFLVAGDAVAFYLYKIIWPKTLLLYYGRNPRYITEQGFIWWTWLVPAIVLSVLWLNRRRCAPALAGFCCFVAALLPVLGFIGFNFQYYSTVTDRYLYLSMFGIALIVGWALERLPRPYALLSVVPLLLLAGRSALQVRYWQDSLTLFGHVLETNPDSAVANADTAIELVRLRDYGDAVEYARRSITLDPNRAESYGALARGLDGLGRTDDAVQTFRDGFRADVRTRVLVNTYVVDLLKKGDPKHALIFARLAVQLVQQAGAYVNLGSALAETEDWQGAQTALQTAVSLDPNNYYAQTNLAMVLYHCGDREGAIAHFRAAVRIDPDEPAALEALNRMGGKLLR
jgi:Flp pilus assembly protein TadD